MNKRIEEELKKRKLITLSVRLNYKMFIQLLDKCDELSLTQSEYLRGLIMNDLKHPSYDTSKYDGVLKVIFKKK